MRAELKPRVTAALRNRDFALLWMGQTVSLAGNGLFAVALPLEVFRLTGSSLDLALIVTARTLAEVFLLLAGGTLVDRMSRRLVMLVSDGVSGVAVGLVALLIAAGAANLAALAALSAVFGIASAFFRPASTAINRDILPTDMLMSASSLTSLSQTLAQFLLGPLAGGILLTLTGPTWAFGLDAVSFAVGAACLAAMHRTERPTTTRSSIVDGVRDGLRYCRSQSWLWWSMIAAGLANVVCFAPFLIMQPLLVNQVFHAGPLVLGAMYAANGLGAAIAAAGAARLPPSRRRVGVIWASWGGAGLAAIALGLAPWLWLAACCAGLTSCALTYGNVRWFPLMQQEVPADLLGRASAVDWLFSLALAPLGTVAGGVAAQTIGVRPTLIVGGIIATTTTVVLLVPGVTDPDRRMAAVPAD
jgi:MFS family permease